MEKVTPECRYGHGEMARTDGLWAFQGMVRLPREQGMRTGVPFMPHDQQFVASLFRCNVCGYLEMFDDDDAAPEGGA